MLGCALKSKTSKMLKELRPTGLQGRYLIVMDQIFYLFDHMIFGGAFPNITMKNQCMSVFFSGIL